jgi:glutamate synthase (NADPH/NADH) large chain
MEAHLHHLRTMIALHVELTSSEWGEKILEDFRTYLPKFWLVKPKAAELGSLIESLRQAA